MLFAAFCKQNQKRAFWQQQEQMYISMFKQKNKWSFVNAPILEGSMEEYFRSGERPKS